MGTEYVIVNKPFHGGARDAEGKPRMYESGERLDASSWRNLPGLLNNRYVRLEDEPEAAPVNLDALAEAVAERLRPTLEAMVEAHRLATPPPAFDLEALATAVADKIKKDKR